MTKTTNDQVILRNSERKLFKECQWKWEREYVDRLKPRRQESVALWFGTGIHLALEEWYVTGKKRGVDPRKTWKQYVYDSDAEMRYVNTSDPLGDFDQAVQALDLGEDMLEGYLAEYGDDDNWEVLGTELDFQIRMPYDRLSNQTGDDLTPPHITREKDDAIVVGTIDLVFRDHSDGTIWLLDHKGLRMTEQVMTPDGWKANGDLVIGDEVIGSDGKPTKVTGVYDLGEKQMYRVHMTDGSYVDTTDDHYWTLYQGERSRVRTTLEVAEELEKPGQNKYVTLPPQPKVEWEEREVPIDPYVLGVLIGDGSLKSGARISNPDEYIFQRVLEAYPEDVREQQVKDRCRTFGINGLRPALRETGLLGKGSKEKFVPEDYLYGSIKQRSAMLAGLMDTDGHVDTNGRTRFSTTSDQLKDDILFLARSLGGRATASSHEAYYTKNGEKHVTGHYWNVSLRMPECPFTMPRHVERWRPAKTGLGRNIGRIEKIDVAEARCIRVEAEDSLYMTKDCIVTHNTAKALGTNNTQFLPMDDQAGLYCAVAERVLKAKGLIGQDERVSGIVYNYLAKRKGDTRPRNAAGLATNKPVKQDYIDALTELGPLVKADPAELKKLKVADLEKRAHDLGVTVLGAVSKQQPQPRFERKTVRRTPAKNRNQLKRVQTDLTSMSLVRDNVLKPTKTTGVHCSFCPFLEICQLDEDGKDWSDMADQMYKTWDPYESHRKELS